MPTKNNLTRVDIPSEMTTEQILKFGNNVPAQQWEEWMEIKWRRL